MSSQQMNLLMQSADLQQQREEDDEDDDHLEDNADGDDDEDDDNEKEEEERAKEVDDDLEDDDEAAPAISAGQHLLNIVEAKSMVICEPVANRKSASSGGSPVWQYYSRVKIRNGLDKDLQNLDPAAYDRIIQRRSNLKFPDVAVCDICMNQPSKTLFLCMNGSPIRHAGNYGTHLRTVHRLNYAESKQSKRSSSSSASGSVAKKSKPGKQSATTFFTKSTKGTKKTDPSTIGSITVLGDASPSQQSQLTSPFGHGRTGTAFQAAIVLGQTQCLDEYHNLVFNFQNNNNIPVRAFESDEFKAMQDFTANNGGTLKKINKRQFHLASRRFTKIRTDKYELLLGGLTWYCTETRSFYETNLKKIVPFLSVGHDIWDSKSKDVLGITVFFWHPTRKQYFKVPIGLVHIEDKKAVPTVQATMKVLERCGISKADIFKAVNDTTNVALKTGRLLTKDEEDGTCAMHLTDLVMEHATGMTKRKENKKIVDSFDVCEAIRVASYKAATWLMQKKAKKRFSAYQKLMRESGRHSVKLVVPNSTRMAGTWSMYHTLVRSRWNLALLWYKRKADKPVVINNSQFLHVAQLEAVLWPCARLSKLLQTDVLGAISYTFIHVMTTLTAYLSPHKRWWVADVDELNNSDELTMWNGNASFPTRDDSGKPIKPAPKGFTEVSMLKMTKDQLSDMPLKLIGRIADEFTRYSAIVTNDQLVAMACNPLTATLGMTELELCVALMADTEGELFQPIKQDYRALSKAALVKAIKDICSEILPTRRLNKDDTDTTAAAGPDATELDSDEEYAAAKNAKRKQLVGKMLQDAGTETMDPVVDMVDNFFDARKNYLPWLEYLTLRGKEKLAKELAGKDLSEHWWTIAQHFDPMEYWNAGGKSQFPLIYYVACLHLPMPDSNGHQERTFSAATWMDGKLNNRQTDATFEMKALIYSNKKFLSQLTTDLDSSHKLAAAEATVRLLDEAQDRRDEEDLSEGDDDALVAYLMTKENEIEAAPV